MENKENNQMTQLADSELEGVQGGLLSGSDPLAGVFGGSYTYECPDCGRKFTFFRLIPLDDQINRHKMEGCGA